MTVPRALASSQSRKLRVLELITELRPAGAERIVFELARGLPADRFEVQVCSLRPATGDVASWLRDADIPVHSLEMRWKLDLRAPRRLARLLERQGIDLVHAHLFHANLLGRRAARRVGCPAVTTVHIIEERFRPWHGWLDRWTLRPGDVEVCVSRAVRDHLHERVRIPAERLRVIPNGVDLDRFRGVGDDGRLRAATGADDGDPVIVTVGRLEPQKGHQELIAAWRNVDSQRAHLAIIGEGSLRARLEEQAQDPALRGRVHLLGHRHDIPELLAGASGFVLPSRYEGFGLVLVEALASGLPVVASGGAAVAEVLGEDGGWLVRSGDTDGLACGLRELLALDSDDRAAREAVARQRSQEFGLAPMLDAYADLLTEVAARSAASALDGD